jgi:hypothetical protein
MRRIAALAISLATLLPAPTSALALKVHYQASVFQEQGTATLSFDAFGKRTERGFAPRRVANFAWTNLAYICQSSPMPPRTITTTLRSDLPFGLIGTLVVTKSGMFTGQYTPPDPNNPATSITGRFEKRGKIVSGESSAFKGGRLPTCGADATFGARLTSPRK